MITTKLTIKFFTPLISALTLVYTMMHDAHSHDTEHKQNTQPGHDHLHETHSSTGHMHKRFEDPEKWAQKFDDPNRDAWQKPDAVVDALALRKNQVLADIGAGTGYFTVRIAKRYPESKIIAVDIEPDMVAYVANRAKAAGLKNVETTLTFADRDVELPEPADVIFIADTYHHIPDREKYFSHLSKFLKKDGKLAIIDFKIDSPEGPPVEHRIKPEQIQKELEPSAFYLEQSVDLLPYQYFLIFKKK